MKKQLSKEVEAARIQHPDYVPVREGPEGFFRIPSPRGEGCQLFILASHGESWDHVSVHGITGREREYTPSWEEMQFVKDRFFEPEEWVVQYHPARRDWISLHPHTLHLWRPQGVDFPRPPKQLIAPPKVKKYVPGLGMVEQVYYDEQEDR